MKFEGEKIGEFSIELPRIGDEVALAPVHIQSWKETYLQQESNLTSEKIDELLAHILEDTTFRRNTITEALEHPEKVFYRVVKNVRGEIVGFFHAEKQAEHVSLEGVYLLDEAKGCGLGSRLMSLFLDWIGTDTPCRLQVFSFNEAAISFYESFGYRKTDIAVEPLWGFLPVVEMERLADD